jgi:hypothetical protein
MITIKSYTDIEQSRKLAEILPLERADMCWYIDDNNIPTHTPDNGFYRQDKNHLPCWSLAALLGVLPDYTLQTNSDGTVFVVCDSKKPMISDAYDNPVDACYEMILKLHELNLL